MIDDNAFRDLNLLQKKTKIVYWRYGNLGKKCHFTKESIKNAGYAHMLFMS